MLRGGGEARVPSFLYPAGQLREMLIRAGFADDVQVESHRLPAGAEIVSDDIVKSAERQGIRRPRRHGPLLVLGGSRAVGAS